MTHKRIITLGTLLALVAGGFGLTAGACDTHQDAPSPAGQHIINGTNATVIQSADGYRNVYFSCFGSTGVYVTSAGGDSSQPSGIAVVTSDPACPAK